MLVGRGRFGHRRVQEMAKGNGTCVREFTSVVLGQSASALPVPWTLSEALSWPAAFPKHDLYVAHGE